MYLYKNLRMLLIFFLQISVYCKIVLIFLKTCIHVWKFQNYSCKITKFKYILIMFHMLIYFDDSCQIKKRRFSNVTLPCYTSE